MAIGKKALCNLNSKTHRAPIMTLFFLWRLHGQERHGYSLMQDMKEIAISACKPSTVYALLAKLEKAGLVKSRIDGKGAHVRRLYKTTQKGWELMQEMKRRKVKGLWREFIGSLLS
ncbi:MAG: PadR family transcriptional regulator [Candidatus Micrarchaeota archaeon]|nr:PadR family transcriptional regulator [Candidatus Micrarchaeota archaeon]